MEQSKSNQMPLGTWDKIEATDSKKDKVKFEINIPRTLVFLCVQPVEHTGEDGGAYYSFDVEENAVPKVLNTSSWSLMRGLKLLAHPTGMFGKCAKITKIMVKGKQTFTVEEIVGQ